MTQEEFLKHIEWANWFIIVCDVPKEGDEETGVLHMTGYHSEPSDSDMDSLEQELLNEKEFGLSHLKRDEDYMMIKLSKEEYLSVMNQEMSDDIVIETHNKESLN